MEPHPHPRVILSFHEISQPALERLLTAALRRYHPCTLDTCPGDRDGARRTGLVATFDDGMADAVEAGAALAVRTGWPMLFYLPTAYLDGEPLWQEALTAWVRAAGPGVRTVLGETVRLPDPTARRRLRDAVVERMRKEPDVPVSEILQRLRKALDPQGRVDLSTALPRPVTWARVRELATIPAVSFGSHTVTHRPLAALTREAIAKEAQESRRRIEEATGRPADHFCYPFGTLAQIGREAPGVVARTYATAVTLHRGIATEGSDPWWLPRVDVYEHDDAIRLSAKILQARLRSWVGRNRRPLSGGSPG